MRRKSFSSFVSQETRVPGTWYLGFPKQEGEKIFVEMPVTFWSDFGRWSHSSETVLSARLGGNYLKLPQDTGKVTSLMHEMLKLKRYRELHELLQSERGISWLKQKGYDGVVYPASKEIRLAMVLNRDTIKGVKVFR